MKFLLSLTKYLIIVVALSAIPFIARMAEVQNLSSLRTWTPQALQAQPWFTRQIRSDEKILWCSGVSPQYKVDDSMPTAFAGVAIALTGVLVIGLLSAAKQAAAAGSLNVFAWMMTISGAALSTAPYWACGHALHSACVLTNSRAINIFETGGCESISYSSSLLARPFVLTGSGECQTLLFYWDYPAQVNHRSDVRKIKTGFKGISDGNSALKILEEQSEQ